MVTAVPGYLEPELMDIVRLFPGAQELAISLSVREEEKLFIEGQIEGESFCFSHALFSGSSLEEKSFLKRAAKTDLYDLLSDRTGRKLPWGSLTGIRPTRLAYGELEKGKPFRPLFQSLRVSEQNIELVERVLRGQESVYERREGNTDCYVSLPFCPSKCDYCSFITAPIGKTRQYVPEYLASLERELAAAKPLIGRLRSVYVGGGTPFALETEELERALRAISPLRENGCEYTVEAGRPDVFTREKLDLCLKYGVTRICINAQSFSDRTLRAIGRNHTEAQLIEAFEMAKDYPFSVNCDLIAGLTGESLQEFEESVEKAIGFSPQNITVHTLCLKRGARLKEEHLPPRGHANVSPLEDEHLLEMIAYSRRRLTESGYEPYYLYRQKYMAGAHENVGWTKPGFASVYNVDVMEEIADNLAFGCNAISKKVFLSEGRIERLASPKDLKTYLMKTDQIISEKEALFSGKGK